MTDCLNVATLPRRAANAAVMAKCPPRREALGECLRVQRPVSSSAITGACSLVRLHDRLSEACFLDR